MLTVTVQAYMRVLAFTNSNHFDFILLLFIFLLGGCKCCLALSSCSIVPLMLFSIVMLYCFYGTNKDRQIDRSGSRPNVSKSGVKRICYCYYAYACPLKPADRVHFSSRSARHFQQTSTYYVTFAICYEPSVCLSVCLSVVCDVGAPYSGG